MKTLGAFFAVQFYRLILVELLLLVIAAAWLGKEMATTQGSFHEPLILVVGILAGIAAHVVTHSNYFTRVTRLSNYDNTMREIERLIRGAQHSVWLFRAHTGDGNPEAAFFQVLQEKIPQLNEVRRVAMNHDSPSMRVHLELLLTNWSNFESTMIRIHEDKSPYFSYMLVDEKVAVLGLPTSDRKGIFASLLIEDDSIVRGLRNAFELLWADSAEIKGRGRLDVPGLATAKATAISKLV